jgi:aldehyde:ferredoxin oxidoreductase
LGLDGISAGGTIAFAMEGFENGLLTLEDTGGIELRFGSERAMLQVLDLIAKREAIGNLLADGSRIAAKKIGKGAEKFAIQTKGVDPGMHDLRIKPGMGLVMGINPMGMDHMVGVHDQGVVKVNPKNQAFGFLEELPANDLGPQKARLISYAFPYAVMQDSLVVCQFVPYNVDETVQLVRTVTGWNTNLLELHKIGLRALALARAFNIREGFTADDDIVPERFFGPTTNGAHKERGIDREAWMACRDMTYQLLGWDLKTGMPTQANLADLGVLWVNEAVK